MKKKILLLLNFSMIFILLSFSKNKVKTTTFISEDGLPVSLTVFANKKFKLIWNEGLLNFELHGSYYEDNDKIILSREDAYYFEQIYQIDNFDSSYLNLYQSVKQYPILTKTIISMSIFDSITQNGKSYLDKNSSLNLDSNYTYNLFYKTRLIEIDPEKNAFFRDINVKTQLNLVICYPNFLISEDEIELKKIGKKHLLFLNLFENKKIKKLR